MDQGSSSATHDSSPNNNENSENDDWEKIGDEHMRYHTEMMKKYILETVSKARAEEAARESTCNPSPSTVPQPPPPLPTPSPSLDPHSHCNSCPPNGGPSTYPYPPAYMNPQAGYTFYSSPVYPPSYSPVPGSHFAPVYMDPGWNRLIQVNSALNRPPSAPVQMTAEQEARYQDALQKFNSRQGKSAADSANDETVDMFMKSLVTQYQMAQSALSTPPTQAGPSTGAPCMHANVPMQMPPVFTQDPSAFGQGGALGADPSTSNGPSYSQIGLSFVMHSLRNILDQQELNQFRDMERRVVAAYARKYLQEGLLHSSSSLPSTAAGANSVYAQPAGMVAPSASNGVMNGVESRSSSLSSSTSFVRQPFNPVCPTPEQNRAISEAIIYVQARWPLGSTDKECTHLGQRDMPPCINYPHFLDLLPHFLTRFGEPLASFLTVLSCFIQDEMARKNISTINLMQNGACEMGREDAPQWENILRGDPPQQPHSFTKENDEKMRGVLRNALRDIGLVDLTPPHFYRDMQFLNGVPIPPLEPPKPDLNEELLGMSEAEIIEFMKCSTLPEKEYSVEVSPELRAILEGMERQGVMPPPYSSAMDLVNKLLFYQYHYGVEPIPPPPQPVAINPMTGQPVTYEEYTRSIATPPELMTLYPNSKKFRYNPCNALHTTFSRKKKIEFLELSDDEESDEAGGLHSLPVSIKREYILGHGSFGTVYEGCVVPLEKADPKMVDMESDDKKVAIKAINMSWFATYPYLKTQLDNEVQTLRQCMGFPAIVQFEGFTESPFNALNPSQHAFIVMELMGCNLAEYVKKQDPHRLSELHAKVIIRQIQAALNYLHCRGISHCDLKPTNILLNDKSTTLPQIKLCDFGHVRFYGVDNITENEICEQTGGLGVANNRGYRAPEHATTKGFSPALDLYALGAVSYFIMTGFIPNLTAPRNVASTQTQTAQKSRKGKKAKKMDETVPDYQPVPSRASTIPGCALPLFDERMLPEEQIFDLVDETHVWPYTSKLSYHFCKEHMRVDPARRINLRDSMDHEWLSGFEMYSMLRRLECKMGLFRPCERHLTTVMDDVNYQRGMLYMASNPSTIQPFSSLSGGGDLSNGSAALLNLYATEVDFATLYAAIPLQPPAIAPLSLDASPEVGLPPSIPPPVSPIPIPVEQSKKVAGKTKKKGK